MTDITTLQSSALREIAAITDLNALEGMRISLLGKQGSVSGLLKTLGQMSADERQVQGPLINGLREAVATALAEKRTGLETVVLNERLSTERIDMTLPAPETARGSIHPVSHRRSGRRDPAPKTRNSLWG